MTTRPTDEEIEEMADELAIGTVGMTKSDRQSIRKAIAEHHQGKRVVLVYPIDKWVLMLLQAGAKVRNLGDVRWLATEDGSQGKGTGRHIACFILDNNGKKEG